MRRRLFAAWARLTALFGRRRFEAELDEELQFHLEEATAKFVRHGLTREAALAAARRQLGNLGVTKDAVRDETGVRPLQDLGRDIRLAVRQVLRRPAFAATILITISTCVAVNTAVFSVVYSVVLAPLPFAEPDSIVRLTNQYPAAGIIRTASSAPEYFERRASADTLREVALYREESNTLRTEGGSRHTFALRVTPSFFPLLQVSPLLGRGFTDDDSRVGSRPVVMLGHTLWQAAFGGRDAVLGTSITLDGTDMEVVGVLPEAFRFPTWDAQVYTPLVFGPRDREHRARHTDSFHMLARLAPGVTVDQAQSQINSLNATVLSTYPPDLHTRITEAGYQTVVRPYREDLTRDVKDPLTLLWIGGMIVLVIGIANVATLVVLRTRQRAQELAVRAALGAGRLRLARQLTVETALLTLAGGACGLLGARSALRLLTTFEVYEIPRVGDVAISGTVMLWTVGAVVSAAILSGLVPALHAVRRPVALSAASTRTQTTASSWPLRLLVSGQIAFAMTLALTTGLLVSSLRQLEAVDTGFDRDHVSVAALIVPGARYPTTEARINLVTRVLEAIETAPGVRRAASATQLPFSGNTTRTTFSVDVPGSATATPFGTTVSDGYFEALGIAVVEGRTFQSSDTRSTAPVAVIDTALAARFWPAGAVGQRFWPAARPGAPDDAVTIVGVVDTIQQSSLRDVDAPGAVYTSVSQASPGFIRLAVKHETANRDWPEVVRRIRSVDRSLTPFWTDTLSDSVEASLLTQRAPTQLLAIFWAIGLLLGVVGIYGVLSYEFSSRRRELAVRLAIGGTRRNIVALIWRRWAVLVGLGVVTGTGGALAAEQVVGSLMFHTSLGDPLVLLGAGVTMAAAAGLAAIGPVRQALRVDPALALKQD